MTESVFHQSLKQPQAARDIDNERPRPGANPDEIETVLLAEAEPNAKRAARVVAKRIRPSRSTTQSTSQCQQNCFYFIRICSTTELIAPNRLPTAKLHHDRHQGTGRNSRHFDWHRLPGCQQQAGCQPQNPGAGFSRSKKTWLCGQSIRSIASKGATRAIGLVLPLQAEKANAENALSIIRLTADVQTMLSPAGYDLFLLPCPAEENPSDFLMRVLARRIADGFIIMGFDLTDDQRQVLDAARVPLVSAGVAPLPDSGFSIGQQMLSHIAAISSAETPGKSGKKKQSL